MEKGYNTCDLCGKVIKYGEAHVAITREEEKVEYSIATDEYSVKNLDAVQFITFCGSCGNASKVESLKDLIRSIPLDEKKENQPKLKIGKEYTSCHRCDKVINFGDLHVTINRAIEDAEYSIATNETFTNVIDSIQITTLCGTCGSSFNTRTLKKLILSIPLNKRGRKNSN